MKNIFYGTIASFSLLAFYAVIMATLQSWSAAVSQFQALWYLMLPLALGFGMQVGLFTKLRQASLANKSCVAASGTSSALGMIACCSHHITDFLPILGLSALSLFLANYQIPILLVSLLMNIFGIILMSKQLRKISV